MEYSDWDPWTGSNMYRAGLANGATDLGGTLYHISGNGNRTPYAENNGRLGYYEDRGFTEYDRIDWGDGGISYMQVSGVESIFHSIENTNGWSAKMVAGGDGSEITLEDLKNGPPTHEDYKAPKSGPRKVRNPNGRGTGWIDKNKDVWIPTDHNGTHAPHWDRQHPDGTHTNVYPFRISHRMVENMVTGGLLIGGAAIVIFDIVTVPSGEGAIGVYMIKQALH